MTHRALGFFDLSLRRFSIAALTVAGAFVPLSGCGNDEAGSDDDSQTTGGTRATGGSGGTGGGIQPSAAHCEALGSLCHEADDGDGPIADCHDLGHSGDAVACAEGFAACVDLCLEPSGAAGAHGEESPLCTFIGSSGSCRALPSCSPVTPASAKAP
jgi:hypothetical protein